MAHGTQGGASRTQVPENKFRRGWGRGTSLGAAGAAEKGRSARSAK